eukprot:352615-Chlamydomonas_euryale.AAC.3
MRVGPPCPPFATLPSLPPRSPHCPPCLVTGALCNDCDLAAEDVEVIASAKASETVTVAGVDSSRWGGDCSRCGQ